MTDPLGVCSIADGERLAIICPVRLREEWLIAEQAAAFFFPEGTRWTTLLEVRLNDLHGKSAGNIDVVLVAYDEAGQITDFGSLEVQSVYISGNLRKAFFKPYSDDPEAYLAADWPAMRKTNPRPDYLSSSRKRLAPQMIYKGGIFQTWGRKQAVAVHSAFYATLPELREVAKEEADLAWLLYDLLYDETSRRYRLTPTRTVYTQFKPTLEKITLAEAGPVSTFLLNLQSKLNSKLTGASASQLTDIPLDVPADETDLIETLENF